MDQQLNTKLKDEYLENYKINDPNDGALKYLKKEVNRSEQSQFEYAMNWRFTLDKELSKQKQEVKLKKRKKIVLTRQQRKKCGLLKLTKNIWNYNELEPMRQLWINYMRENLKLIGYIPDISDRNWNNFSQIISKSELIGSNVKIVRSKVPSQVGIEGTLVLESKMTFQLVTKDNQLKIIPKQPSVFQIELDNIRFTIFGKHLIMKPSERTVKKIRSQMQPDLK